MLSMWPKLEANLTLPISTQRTFTTHSNFQGSITWIGRSRDGSGLMFRPTRVLCKAAALTPELLKSHLPPKWSGGLARPHVGMYPVLAYCKRVKSPDESTGLAISGGVDSMALATLCSGLRELSQQGKQALSFTAFIVDHGLRPGSRDEAVQVAGFLDQLSMPNSHLGYLLTKR
jgi:hypothetical protein